MVTKAPPPKPRSRPPLLTGWVERRLIKYVEPQREGTPRGEVVGFSRKKYHAALLTLTMTPLRAVAARVGVSYDLLLKWRSEPAFKATVETEAALYAGLVWTMAEWGSQQFDHEEAELLRRSPVEIARHGLPAVSYVWGDGGPSLFSDAALYGEPLHTVLIDMLRSRATDDTGMWLEYWRIVDEVLEPVLGPGAFVGAIPAPERRKLWRESLRALADIAFTNLLAEDFDATNRGYAVLAMRDLVKALRVDEDKMFAAIDVRDRDTAAARAEDAASRNGHRVVVPPHVVEAP